MASKKYFSLLLIQQMHTPLKSVLEWVNLLFMAQRKIIIGAIGGDRQADAAAKIGAAVAKAGCILLTGGQPQSTGEVKDESMQGAASSKSGYGPARLIGILPSKREFWDEVRPHRLILHTGLEHNFRNVINALTPDVLIAFGGSRGTLAEIAFGLLASKKVVLAPGLRHEVLDRLYKNYLLYFGGCGNLQDTSKYLLEPIRLFGKFLNGAPDLRLVQRQLEKFFDERAKEQVNLECYDEIVDLCLSLVPDTLRSEGTGFPGLITDPGSKQRFEEIVIRISQ